MRKLQDLNQLSSREPLIEQSLEVMMSKIPLNARFEIIMKEADAERNRSGCS